LAAEDVLGELEHPPKAEVRRSRPSDTTRRMPAHEARGAPSREAEKQGHERRTG
jgi:hypothetical protein